MRFIYQYFSTIFWTWKDT